MVELRTASVADVAMLRQWDDDPDVIASGGDDGPWDWDAEIPRAVPWREFLIAETDGKPCGFLQLIDASNEETHYWGVDTPAGVWAIDIWIGSPAFRGRGLGEEMMKQALDRCFERHDATAVLIDPLASNERARRFYERIGFRFVEYRRFGTDECCVYRIDRSDWISGGGSALR